MVERIASTPVPAAKISDAAAADSQLKDIPGFHRHGPRHRAALPAENEIDVVKIRAVGPLQGKGNPRDPGRHRESLETAGETESLRLFKGVLVDRTGAVGHLHVVVHPISVGVGQAGICAQFPFPEVRQAVVIRIFGRKGQHVPGGGDRKVPGIQHRRSSVNRGPPDQVVRLVRGQRPRPGIHGGAGSEGDRAPRIPRVGRVGRDRRDLQNTARGDGKGVDGSAPLHLGTRVDRHRPGGPLHLQARPVGHNRAGAGSNTPCGTDDGGSGVELGLSRVKIGFVQPQGSGAFFSDLEVVAAAVGIRAGKSERVLKRGVTRAGDFQKAAVGET